MHETSSDSADEKMSALTWAINRCRSQLRLPPQNLSIVVTNRPLLSNECEKNEKKIAIGDEEIVTYEHYSEPGNPFLSYKYDDFYYFMRSWLAPTIKGMTQSWILFNPENKNDREKAKGYDAWSKHIFQNMKKSQKLHDVMYSDIDELLDEPRMHEVKLLLFGRDKLSGNSLEQKLLGECFSPDGISEFRYVFRHDGFTLYDGDQPKQFIYQIRAIKSRRLLLDTTFLQNNYSNSITLYFFDNGNALEYRDGEHRRVLRRRENSSNPSS